MKKLHITELAVKTTEAVIDMGVDPLTAWAEHNSAYKQLLVMHKEKDLEYLDGELLKQYVVLLGEPLAICPIPQQGQRSKSAPRNFRSRSSVVAGRVTLNLVCVSFLHREIRLDLSREARMP